VERGRELYEEVRKMQKGLKKIGSGLVAAGLSIVLLLTAAIPVCEAGLDEKVVKVGLNLALTGPATSTTVPIAEGFLDMLRYANDERFLGDVKIKVLWEDHKAEVPKGVTSFKRHSEAGVVGVVETIMGCCEVITPLAQRYEIPVTHEGGFTSMMITKPVPWVFAQTSGWASDAATGLKWVKDNWYKDRTPKCGGIVQHHVSGFEVLRCSEWLPEIGWDYVGGESVSMGAIDTSVEWLRLAEKKPDVIFMYAVGSTEVTLIKDACRLGIQERGIKLFHAIVFAEAIQRIVGDKASEGWLAQTPAATPSETQLSGVRRARETAKRYRNRTPDELGRLYIVSMLPALILIEGIRIAIEKVGLENLTGRAVREGIVSIKDFDSGLQTGLHTVTDRKPWWDTMFAIERIESGGERVRVSNAFPAICFEKYEWD